MVVWVSPRSTTVGVHPGFHNRRQHIAAKIRSLLNSLTKVPSEYDKNRPKIEYWIEYVLRERFVTVDELVEDVSCVAWEQGGSFASVGRFLKEFYDTPRRSEQARSFVDKLCEHVLRWFAIAAVEDSYPTNATIASGDGPGFMRAASFVGYLVEWGLLSDELVRRHLIKPLITHNDDNNSHRANAIYQLFIVAGSTLLRGLLESEDIQLCFDTLDVSINRGYVAGLNAGKLQEFREIHTGWLEEKEKAKNTGDAETDGCLGKEEEEAVAAEIKTPVAFVPRDLPRFGFDSDIPSSTLQGFEPSSVLRDVWSSSETSTSIPETAVTSPTLSISTVSDLTPTELGEDTEHVREQATTCHDMFYFEDGNVEIVCEDTVFRVHSTIVSFSSPKLRDMLTPTALLNAPRSEGCPRIVFVDNAEDFAVLLKMIYTPGFPARRGVPEFPMFASLLRMATKYGFSDLREQLVEELKGAYPIKWEDYETARVLGEDVFGSPKPHPNAVLNLFVAQNVRFAIPFAYYRASTGGLSVLMSDAHGTVLPRHTLANAIYGMGVLQRMMPTTARTIAFVMNLVVCTERTCILSAGVTPQERRIEALRRLSDVMYCEGQDGVLSAPSLVDVTCARCTKPLEAWQAECRSACWEKLPTAFAVAESWNEV